MALVSQPLFDFNKNADISSWTIVNDGVMGGLSKSTISINENGHGFFKGKISLENNGGFASVRFDCGKVKVNNHKFIALRIKGDGKKYQMRIKDDKNAPESYISFVETTGDWETVKIKLSDFYPSFRGRTLDKPNFQATSFEEFGILFGNKKEESFELLIDRIELE